jgi:hypothetical protein
MSPKIVFRDKTRRDKIPSQGGESAKDDKGSVSALSSFASFVAPPLEISSFEAMSISVSRASHEISGDLD